MRRTVLLFALSASLACSSGAEPAAASPSSTAAFQLPGGAPMGVLTRNLYLGADLTPVIQAADAQQFLAATTAVWAMVNRNDFHVRARAIAEEVAWTRPALIGLQEAYTWRVQDPGDALSGGTTPATTVVYDYVPELLAQLHRRGLHYR